MTKTVIDTKEVVKNSDGTKSVGQKKAGFSVKQTVNGMSAFFEDTKAELRKVSWLDKKKLFVYFAIVMIITISVTVLVTVGDVIIAEFFKLLNTII